jgi:spectinomycin phosphotransferase
MDEDGSKFFLKVKKGKFNPSSVLVPNFLKDQGIKQVVETIPTVAHQPWHSLKGFLLLLYPYINGPSGMEVGLTDDQWIEYGWFLKKLHTTNCLNIYRARYPRNPYPTMDHDGP